MKTVSDLLWQEKPRAGVKVLDQSIGKNYALYHADCVEGLRNVPDDSVGLTITSPPFSKLYTYSDSARDMGNTRDDKHFFQNFRYLIPELLRVTIPGRLCVIHCKDLPTFLGSDGSAGLRDFLGDIVQAFVGEQSVKLMAQLDVLHSLQERLESPIIAEEMERIEALLMQDAATNWAFHSRVCVWKDPKIERERTNNSGLLHGQLAKDSSASRQGMADYLLVFRKWSPEMDGLNSTEPVTREPGTKTPKLRFFDYIGEKPPEFCQKTDPRNYSIHVWRKYASPTWHDIQQTDVLNAKLARKKGEPHICPLQIGLIARCVELWSNKGDVVLDPFNGVGSTGYKALQMGRRYIGTELKGTYFKEAQLFLDSVDTKYQATISEAA